MQAPIFDIQDEHDVSSNLGVVLKTILGIVIAFAIAIPRFFDNNFFGEMFYTGNFFIRIITVTLFAIITGVIWFFLYRLLLKDKGPILNLIVYIITAAFAGLFLGNSLLVAVSWIGLYSDLDVEVVKYALELTTVITFIAVVGGVIVLPKLKITEGRIKFAYNVALLLAGLSIASFIFYLIAILFAGFGMTGLLNFYGSLFYGTNIFSIIISIIGVILAEIMFLATLTLAKGYIGKSPKYFEYFIAITLVNGIIRLYTEIFKLVLKLLARSRD